MWQQDYIWQSGQVVAVENAAGGPCATCYLSYDLLGSPRLVTDQNANVIARHDFAPFGQEIPAGVGARTSVWGATDALSQRFTGQVRDAETGLDFLNARYMSSGLTRFTSADPNNAGVDITNPQSLNGYAYVLGNPVVLVDPSGMADCSNPQFGNQTIACVQNTPKGPDFATSSDPYVVNNALYAFWFNSLQFLSSSGGGGGAPTYTVTGTGAADRSPQPVSTTPGSQLAAPTKNDTCGAVPAHPQSASVNSNIRQAQIVSTVSLLGGPLTQAAVSLGWFAEKELPNKAWDYKTPGQQYDAFGNFNYGAAGAALGLPSYVLQTAGGALSTVLGTNNQSYGKWYQPPHYGHAPAKSTAISAGIGYYQNGCSF